MFFIQTIRQYLCDRRYEKDKSLGDIKNLQERVNVIEKLLKMHDAHRKSCDYIYSYLFTPIRKYRADLGNGCIRTLITGEEGRLVDGEVLDEEEKKK